MTVEFYVYFLVKFCQRKTFTFFQKVFQTEQCLRLWFVTYFLKLPWKRLQNNSENNSECLNMAFSWIINSDYAIDFIILLWGHCIYRIVSISVVSIDSWFASISSLRICVWVQPVCKYIKPVVLYVTAGLPVYQASCFMCHSRFASTSNQLFCMSQPVASI